MKNITMFLVVLFLTGCAGTFETPVWAEGLCLGCSSFENPDGNGGGGDGGDGGDGGGE